LNQKLKTAVFSAEIEVRIYRTPALKVLRLTICLYIIYFQLFIYISVNIIFKNQCALNGKHIFVVFLRLFVIIVRW